jgi:hypothetical protein
MPSLLLFLLSLLLITLFPTNVTVVQGQVEEFSRGITYPVPYNDRYLSAMLKIGCFYMECGPNLHIRYDSLRPQCEYGRQVDVAATFLWLDSNGSVLLRVDRSEYNALFIPNVWATLPTLNTVGQFYVIVTIAAANYCGYESQMYLQNSSSLWLDAQRTGSPSFYTIGTTPLPDPLFEDLEIPDFTIGHKYRPSLEEHLLRFNMTFSTPQSFQKRLITGFEFMPLGIFQAGLLLSNEIFREMYCDYYRDLGLPPIPVPDVSWRHSTIDSQYWVIHIPYIDRLEPTEEPVNNFYVWRISCSMPFYPVDDSHMANFLPTYISRVIDTVVIRALTPASAGKVENQNDYSNTQSNLNWARPFNTFWYIPREKLTFWDLSTGLQPDPNYDPPPPPSLILTPFPASLNTGHNHALITIKCDSTHRPCSSSMGMLTYHNIPFCEPAVRHDLEPEPIITAVLTWFDKDLKIIDKPTTVDYFYSHSTFTKPKSVNEEGEFYYLLIDMKMDYQCKIEHDANCFAVSKISAIIFDNTPQHNPQALSPNPPTHLSFFDSPPLRPLEVNLSERNSMGSTGFFPFEARKNEYSQFIANFTIGYHYDHSSASEMRFNLTLADGLLISPQYCGFELIFAGAGNHHNVLHNTIYRNIRCGWADTLKNSVNNNWIETNVSFEETEFDSVFALKVDFFDKNRASIGKWSFHKLHCFGQFSLENIDVSWLPHPVKNPHVLTHVVFRPTDSMRRYSLSKILEFKVPNSGPKFDGDDHHIGDGFDKLTGTQLIWRDLATEGEEPEEEYNEEKIIPTRGHMTEIIILCSVLFIVILVVGTLIGVNLKRSGRRTTLFGRNNNNNNNNNNSFQSFSNSESNFGSNNQEPFYELKTPKDEGTFEQNSDLIDTGSTTDNSETDEDGSRNRGEYLQM